jgi:hypothetical protein
MKWKIFANLENTWDLRLCSHRHYAIDAHDDVYVKLVQYKIEENLFLKTHHMAEIRIFFKKKISETYHLSLMVRSNSPTST